jgi:LEA14-like dessication related protein
MVPTANRKSLLKSLGLTFNNSKRPNNGLHAEEMFNLQQKIGVMEDEMLEVQIAATKEVQSLKSSLADANEDLEFSDKLLAKIVKGENEMKVEMTGRVLELEADGLRAALNQAIKLEVVEEQSQTILELKCQLEAAVLDASVEHEITHDVVEEQSQTIAELKCQLEATVLDASVKQEINLEVFEEQSQTIAELKCQLVAHGNID